jgi:hypothetical protein
MNACEIGDSLDQWEPILYSSLIHNVKINRNCSGEFGNETFGQLYTTSPLRIQFMQTLKKNAWRKNHIKSISPQNITFISWWLFQLVLFTLYFYSVEDSGTLCEHSWKLWLNIQTRQRIHFKAYLHNFLLMHEFCTWFTKRNELGTLNWAPEVVLWATTTTGEPYLS